MAADALTFSDFAERVGTELGQSDWVLIDQGRIAAFAEVTGDHQFIHIDPERAAATPLGGTIAHGFLILSLAPMLAIGVVPEVRDVMMQINYGLEALRFVSPVRAGKRVRGRFKLKAVEARKPGQYRVEVGFEVEIEGEAKPALTADLISLIFV